MLAQVRANFWTVDLLFHWLKSGGEHGRGQLGYVLATSRRNQWRAPNETADANASGTPGEGEQDRVTVRALNLLIFAQLLLAGLDVGRLPGSVRQAAADRLTLGG